jgi:hypothetical protein
MNKSAKEYIHLVAFDIPYPANYGGVIDIFYKIKSLHACGVKVILHCYEYGRSRSAELNKICHAVYYYKRRTFKNPFYSKLPYIVASRNTGELLENLKNDSHPILFEGLHCCYYLSHPELKSRLKIVRTHNIEHDYYKKLEEIESNFFKKYFFRVESERLKKFETVLKHADIIAAISPADFRYFKKKYNDKVIYLPAFHPNEQTRSVNGKGEFALYHGNLAVGENDEAARFLADHVFADPGFSLVIAGSNPSPALLKSIEGKSNIRLLSQLNSSEMLDYIKNAHVNILPTFQSTGIKLKLINALYLGRHCLVNLPMVQNTGLEDFCTIANTPRQFQKSLEKLWKKPFSVQELQDRKTFLEAHFNNRKNILLLLDTISSKKK